MTAAGMERLIQLVDDLPQLADVRTLVDALVVEP